MQQAVYVDRKNCMHAYEIMVQLLTNTVSNYFDLQPATTLLHTAPYQSHSHTKTVELMFPDGGQLDMAVYHRNPGSQGSRHFFVEMETPVVRSLSTGDRPTFNFHYIVIYIVAMAITAL